MQYLERRPTARVLLVTDDSPFLEFATAALAKRGVQYVYTNAARGKNGTPVFSLKQGQRLPAARIGREVRASCAHSLLFVHAVPP